MLDPTDDSDETAIDSLGYTASISGVTGCKPCSVSARLGDINWRQIMGFADYTMKACFSSRSNSRVWTVVYADP